MLKLLLVVLVLLALAGGLIYFRFFKSSSSVVSPTSTESSSTPSETAIEVPKTLPGASIDDKVKTLQDTLTKLVEEVNKLKSSTITQNLDLRLKAVESSIVDLKVRVSSLEKNPATQSTTTQTSSTNPPSYIPLSSGGSTNSQNWVTIDTYTISLNSSDYSGYKNAQLEISMRKNQPGDPTYARLYNLTDNTAASTEVSTTSTSFSWISSSGFSLASGSKTYVLQVKVPDGIESFIQSARIKVNY